MNDSVIQAVRDGLTAAGELVAYTDAGDIDTEIVAVVSFGVDAYSEDGEPMRDVITLRAMASDLAAMTKSARFTLDDGRVFKKMKMVRRDRYTTVFTLGEVSV